MRKPLLAANWKMYKTVREAVVYTKEFRGMVRDISDADIVLAPPFTALQAVAEAARDAPLGVAGQDLYWEQEGAYTGEVSATMLKEAGADWVIIGHSERRGAFWRDGRHGECQNGRGLGGGSHTDCLHRRNARRV